MISNFTDRRRGRKEPGRKTEKIGKRGEIGQKEVKVKGEEGGEMERKRRERGWVEKRLCAP